MKKTLAGGDGISLGLAAVGADGELGGDEGVQSHVAPGDHTFSDLLWQAARERDAPDATFTDPGQVASADRELARSLVLIERACGQTIPQAKRAARQLLAERDRVLRERVATKLPPIAPEELARMIKALTAMLDPAPPAPSARLGSSLRSGHTGPGRPDAAGPG